MSLEPALSSTVGAERLEFTAVGSWTVAHSEQIERLVGEIRPVDCVAPSGGVVAMRPLTLHASSKSADDRPRRVLHIEYAASMELGGGIELAAG